MASLRIITSSCSLRYASVAYESFSLMPYSERILLTPVNSSMLMLSLQDKEIVAQIDRVLVENAASQKTAVNSKCGC